MTGLEIENGILINCDDELESIIIPKEVWEIRTFAFGYKLREVLADEENDYFTSVDGVLYTKDMKALVHYPAEKTGKIYVLPSSVEKIYDNALRGTELEYIEVEDGNKHFKSADGILYSKDTKVLVAYPRNRENEEYEVCEGCETICGVNSHYVRRLRLPKSIRNVNGDRLGGFYRLAEIEVHEENKCFTSIDGVLYTKNMKTLVKYPRRKAGRSYAVPLGVEQIGKYAFSFCCNLVKVKLPDCVKKLEADAFSNMWELRKIKIPKGVKKIPVGCFSCCGELKRVVLHNDVTRINEAAFMGCEKLKRIRLPKSLTKIGELAFWFAGLKRVKLPYGVNATGAFDGGVKIRNGK